MADSAAYARQNYPLPVYNFRVDVGGTTLSFSEVSGVALEHELITYFHGLSFFEGEPMVPVLQPNPVTVTMKRGVVLGASPTALYDWMKAKEIRSVDVSLCDESGTPVMSWKIAKAIPVKLEAPKFDAGGNEGAIETLELKARGITLVKQ